MSTFLLNHPISHVVVINVVLFVVALSFGLVAVTLAEVFRVPAGAWARGTTARSWWIAAGVFSALLYPLSAIVSIGWAGHDGLLLCLPSLPFVALWWLYTRRRLQTRAADIGLSWPARQSSQRRQWFFGTADTKTLKSTGSRSGAGIHRLERRDAGFHHVDRRRPGLHRRTWRERSDNPTAPVHRRRMSRVSARGAASDRLCGSKRALVRAVVGRAGSRAPRRGPPGHGQRHRRLSLTSRTGRGPRCGCR